jgi:hypothetical protein
VRLSLAYAAAVSERLLKLLDLVQKELKATEARLELSTRDPSDERTLVASLRGGWQLVVVLAAPPSDPDGASARLETLAKSFIGLTNNPDDWSAMSRELVARRLDDELAEISERAGAVRALVIDRQSPMIWGTSGARRSDEDVDTGIKTAEALDAVAKAGVDVQELASADADRAKELLATKGAPATFLSREAERIRSESRSGNAWRHHLLVSKAIFGARRSFRSESQGGAHLRVLVHEADFGYLARAFASIYCLIVVFDGAFSELHAEAAAVHGLGTIERLVLALPPVDPPPRGGKVISLRQPSK